MNTRIIALWSTPRSVSTAFERCFIERGDFDVCHEPFSAAYYFSNNRCSNRYAEVTPLPEHDFEHVANDLLRRSRRSPVFFKDLAYHAKRYMDHGFFDAVRHTFIIRDPRWAIPSLFKLLPDFELEETGYELQYQLFEKVSARYGTLPIVIDAGDFCDNPEAMMCAYAQKLEIPFISRSLTWQAGPVEAWRLWRRWHVDAENSTRIFKHGDPGEVPGHLRAAYAHSERFYDELRKYRLTPAPTYGG